MDITEITQEIFHILKAEVMEVKERVFPLVAAEGTAFPFIVFERNGFERNTKDGGYMTFSFEIRVVSNTYFDGLKIAEKVIKLMKRTDLNPTLQNATEEYTENSYIQTLTFSI